MFETPEVVIRPPEMPATPPFVQYNTGNEFLTRAQCGDIIEYAESEELLPGTIGNGTNDSFYEDKDYRCVSLRELQSKADKLEWLFEIIRDKVTWANNDFFRFDLHGLLEGLQYLRYDASEENPGKYDWHQDYGGGYSSHRKLSVVIQLSNPEEYEGCELRMFTSEDFAVPTLSKGTGVIFPSWQPHCVTPIVSGVRRALVGWVSGPQFR